MTAFTVPNLNRRPAATPALSADVLRASSKLLFGSVCTSLLLIEPTGEIVFANNTAEEMIGCSSDSLEGVTLDSLFEPAQGEPTIAVSRRNSSVSGVTRINGKLHCGGGLVLPVRLSLRFMQDHTGEILGDVVTVEDLSDAMQMGEYVQMMAHHDLHTGLPRVEAILPTLDASLRRLQASAEPFAVVQIGLDDFRRINESMGHAAGNRALCEVAKRIGSSLGQDDVLARAAGDEFLVVFTHCPTRDEAVARASELLRMFDEPFHVDGRAVRISAGFGVSFADSRSATRESVFNECDLALRRSKFLGGSRVLCFEPTMAIWQSSTVQMESEMQAAIDREEFYVVYQPQICLKTGRLIGVEALLRWNSPTNGLIMPNTFIPFAEESGMIVPLGEWCLRTACREVVALQKALGYPVTLAVNVSPRQARAKGFQQTVQSALSDSGLDPKYLEVEITEGLLISNEDHALRMIASLQEIGVSVAMDDFGMGFSNLGYITRFKVDRLKIDRSFVAKCTSDRSSKMITVSILFLARSLGIQVVAEGVETEEQAALLAGLECDVAQGYLYSRPTTIAEIHKIANQFTAPKPVIHAAEIADGAPQAWLSRVSSPALLLANDIGQPEPKLSTNPANMAVVEISSTAPGRPRAGITSIAAHKKNVASASIPSFDCIEPRDPVCRPVHPARNPAAARVRMQAVAEDADPYVVPHSFPGPQFKLVQ